MTAEFRRLAQQGMPHSPLLLWQILKDRAGGDGACRVKIEVLAIDMSRSTAATRKSMDWLEAHGWVAVERTGKASIYRPLSDGVIPLLRVPLECSETSSHECSETSSLVRYPDTVSARKRAVSPRARIKIHSSGSKKNLTSGENSASASAPADPTRAGSPVEFTNGTTPKTSSASQEPPQPPQLNSSPSAQLFTFWRRYLEVEHGLTDKGARSILGKWRCDFRHKGGDAALIRLLGLARDRAVQDIIAYVQSAAQGSSIETQLKRIGRFN